MIILGIESSCDDTSVALLDCSDQGCVVLSEKTASQIDVHKKYGGVVPEIAGRMHAEKIIPLIEEILKNQPKPDAIAVTAGPGLITGLIVGVEAARTLSMVWNIPLIATNHLQGHVYSVELTPGQKIAYPAIALVVSGGHTEIVQIDKAGSYQVLGATKDDAAGECFDKVAKLLNIPYPGGPQISKLAMTGKTDAVNLPRPMIKENNFQFSFSGLKTAALYWLRDHKLAVISPPLFGKIFSWLPGQFGISADPITREDFCASFEQSVIDVLAYKTLKAVEKIKPKTLVLAGGVSANKKLRETLQKNISENFPETKFLCPELKYCMDNGAMIAVAGYYQTKKNNYTKWEDIKADPNWHLND
ncbi:MAG: tRNA (adenosine(37)-N6)-threonylcarbamoyltransferase complex transferase subunit TsaD [Candidatus Magasanikbacteria bacterium]|nr:tRNA (adenosine(37)-N6)-threonylcarbamoyltransferase complex transferase subunit TsaD [Candidatus Magasanikbacteria bacterium]